MAEIRRRTRTLVIGSGLAGLYAALSAAERGGVIVATRRSPEESSSYWAQGGVAAAVGEGDTIALHEADTLRVGRGICSPSAVSLLTEDAPRQIERLRALGVEFETEQDTAGGPLELGLEAGHSRRRIVHAGGGSTGRVIVEALVKQLLHHPNIRVLEDARCIGLISDRERCYGAHTTRGALEAETTILATGGAASLYARTTNPPKARGRGIAFAWRAGAAVADMEFVQFHPTALATGGPGDGFLISEAVRGEGAHLLNAAGVRFMVDRHPNAELAPRDELSRAIFDELERTGESRVYLSLAHLDPAIASDRFTSIAGHLARLGIDMARDRIPVAPAAHYMMGGVLTDLHGRTNVPGLLAVGEVACTGVHGANRLASNSLMECLVFADRAGKVEQEPHPSPADLVDIENPGVNPVLARQQMRDIAQQMWSGAGVIRTAASLERPAQLCDPDTCGPIGAPVDDALLVAALIAQAALQRTESRGAHFRGDFPTEQDAWQRHIVRRIGVAPELAEME